MFKYLFKNKSKDKTLRKRYFYKLWTNLVGLGIGAVTQSIIPRGLGPKTYGDYNYLMNFFTQIVTFFDSGSSSCLYTRLSQRQKEFKLVSFYFYFVGIAAALIIFLVLSSYLTGMYNILWPNQLLICVYLAAILSIFIWITNTFTRIADAYGLTVSAEKAKIIQKAFALVCILLLFSWNKLTLKVFFLFNYFVLILLGVLFYYILRIHGFHIRENWKITYSEIKKYFQEFYSYSHPLLLCSLVGMIVGIFDKWLLQVCAGSAEQGFFGLSYQIGAICFMFTSAMTPLIMREFAIAYNNKDLKLMAQLFRRHVPLLYSITALLACFTAVNSDKITLIIGGGRFQGAVLAVAVMSFYPIHQVYGQICSSVFFASDKIKLFSTIALIFMFLSIPVTYFLIAPRNWLGLEAGALGLACSMVVIQILSVNIQLYFNSKLLKFSFLKYLFHQLFSAALFLIIAIISKVIVSYIFNTRTGIIMSLLCSGLLYLTMIFIVVYFYPITIGINRHDFNSLLKKH